MSKELDIECTIKVKSGKLTIDATIDGDFFTTITIEPISKIDDTIKNNIAKIMEIAEGFQTMKDG